jgi:hypothetical protein
MTERERLQYNEHLVVDSLARRLLNWSMDTATRNCIDQYTFVICNRVMQWLFHIYYWIAPIVVSAVRIRKGYRVLGRYGSTVYVLQSGLTPTVVTISYDVAIYYKCNTPATLRDMLYNTYRCTCIAILIMTNIT